MTADRSTASRRKFLGTAAAALGAPWIVAASSLGRAGVPAAKFGIAFCESSGPCLIRSAGNDEPLRAAAVRNAEAVAAGHAFIVILRDAYPINVLNAVKQCQEVCTIYCASANPIEVVVAVTEQGRGVMGVVDGFPPKGVETPMDAADRKAFLRKIGYKA